MNRTNAAEAPVGYRVEYRAGRYCFYSPEALATEKYAYGGRICGLFAVPQIGCGPDPAAYRGRYWHEAKHYADNGAMDPDAMPLYLGHVLHDPEDGAHTAAPSGQVPCSISK